MACCDVRLLAERAVCGCVLVPYSGHYMYRTVVTICTAQWSLYVLHSGHYMYCTVHIVTTVQYI